MRLWEKKTLYIYIYSCKFEKHIKTTSLEKKKSKFHVLHKHALKAQLQRL